MSESAKTTLYGWSILIGMGLLLMLLTSCHRCQLGTDAVGDMTVSCLPTSDEMLRNTRAYLKQHQPNDQRVITKGKRWEI